MPSRKGHPEPHDIAAVLGVDPKTLRKHYREELDFGETKANAQVAGFLFNSARNGNVTAQIFWLKTRAQWKEAPAELRHSGTIRHKPVSEMTDQEIMDRLMELAPGVDLEPIKPARPASIVDASDREPVEANGQAICQPAA